MYYIFPRDHQPMTTRRAPELSSFGNYHAASAPAGGPHRIRSCDRPPNLSNLSPSLLPRLISPRPAPKPKFPFFRECKLCCSKYPTQPAEGITTAATAFQPKACRPIPPALGLVSTQQRSPYENPIPFPKGHPKCPWGWAPQPPTKMSPAECHAESARLKNAKIKNNGPRLYAQCET